MLYVLLSNCVTFVKQSSYLILSYSSTIRNVNVLINFDDVIDDVVLITWYGGLFGQSLCDVKHDFKSSFVAKQHRIF